MKHACTAILAALLSFAPNAHADVQRCIGMKPDGARLACFDAEVKTAPAGTQSMTETRPTARHAGSSDSTCYTGPRGGRYRMVNGRKRYDC